MRLNNRTAEIERAASADQSRPVLCNVYLNTEEGTLEATDSYIAAFVPVEIEDGDTSGLIPAEAIKAHRKASQRVEYSLSANGEAEIQTSDGLRTWKRPDGTWPRLREVAPDEYSTFRVAFDPEKLFRLAKALGVSKRNGSVVLEFALQAGKEEGEDVGCFPSNMRPIRVTAHGSDGWGILMPVRVPGSEARR